METLEGGDVLGAGLLAVGVEGLGELVEELVFFGVWGYGWWREGRRGGYGEGEVVVH